ILASKYHCEGKPDSCPTPSADQMVLYKQPIDEAGSDRYVRLSSLLAAKDQIFTLPMEKQTGISHNGWLYEPGSWHHAFDFGKGGDSYGIVAAAPGKVIHVGWDVWSGGNVVVSHDVGGKKDVYRTI